MKKRFKIIIKWGIALFSTICIRLIKSYFVYPNDHFRLLLKQKGFHVTVQNNPQIVFESINKTIENKSVLYFNYIASWLLSGFYLSVKLKCWIPETNSSYLLKAIKFQQAYIEDISLLYDAMTFSPYKEIELPNKHIENKKNIVIYTVITGNYETLVDPVYVSEDCDYILFTDNIKIKSKIWQIQLLSNKQLDKVKLSRHPKILPHLYLDTKYDYSIYVDGRTLIAGDIQQLVKVLNDNINVAFIKHNSNKTVKEELDLCVKCQVFTKQDLPFVQWEHYLNEGFKDEMGSIEGGLIIRKHKEKSVINLMNAWWNEIMNFTTRDQLSIMYVLWKSDYKNHIILDGSVWSNQFSIIKKRNELRS